MVNMNILAILGFLAVVIALSNATYPPRKCGVSSWYAIGDCRNNYQLCSRSYIHAQYSRGCTLKLRGSFRCGTYPRYGGGGYNGGGYYDNSGRDYPYYPSSPHYLPYNPPSPRSSTPKRRKSKKGKSGSSSSGSSGSGRSGSSGSSGSDKRRHKKHGGSSSGSGHSSG